MNHLSEDATREEALAYGAQALASIAYQLECLGNGGAATSMGALEAHGQRVGEALDHVAEAIAGAGEAIAAAISVHGMDVKAGLDP